MLNRSLTQLLCASLESTAVIAVPQTGHYFLAQIIQFTSNIFCGGTEQCLCRSPLSLLLKG